MHGYGQSEGKALQCGRAPPVTQRRSDGLRASVLTSPGAGRGGGGTVQSGEGQGPCNSMNNNI